MIDGVGNRGRDGYSGQLAKPLGAERARLVIKLANEHDIEFRDIGIGRHEIAREVAVDEPAGDGIGFRLLEQGLASAPGNATDRLAARGLGINDLPGVVSSKDPVQAYQPEIRIDTHLGEYRREAEDRLRSV